METVQGQLLALQQENETLKMENQRLLEQYQRLRKQELISHLLRGRFLDENAMLQDLHALGVHLNQDDYIVLGLRVLTAPEPMGEDEMFFDLYVRRLEEILVRNIEREYECNVAHVESGAICLIGMERLADQPELPQRGKFQLPPTAPNRIDHINQMALRIYDEIRSGLDLEVFIAVSRPGRGITGIPEAYSDVKKIMDYKRMMNVDVPVLCYHDFELEENAQAVDYNALQLEKEYLRQVELRDYAKARETMHHILHLDFVQTLPSLHTVKIKTAAKLHALLITLERFDSDRDPEAYKQIAQSLEQIEADVLTMAQLEQLVDQIFDRIDQYVDAGSKESTPRWLTEMLAYIEGHYRQADLNVSSISHTFQMTPSYLSKETKRYTGSTLFDYIQTLRLEYAQILLSQGRTTQEAASDSGFGDVRSMRRAFHKYLGTTPRQYSGEKA